ncbi:MAG: iron ABC transporter substrate-binding protein, partial [Nitratireductor sp.]
PNKENAIKLMEFLASPKAQQIYGEQVFEYPVAPNTPPSDLVKAFGDSKPDTRSLADIAKNRQTASERVDTTGFNDGPNS